jgi:signal transduction histidine kinase
MSARDPMARPRIAANAHRDRDDTNLSDIPLDYKDSPDLTWLNRRLRDLLMHAPSAIGITLGPEHRWAYVNIARAKMAGRSGVEDFIGKAVRDSYPELEGQPFFDALDRVYNTGIPFVGKEIKGVFNRGPNGSPDVAYLNCVYQPIRNPEGKVEGLLIHTVEVTEQVLARHAVENATDREQQQRALAEFERNQLQELFKQAPAGIAMLSGPDHRWTFANATYCEIVGRQSDSLLNRPLRETLPELAGQGFFELLDQVYRTGVAYVGKDVRAIINRGPEQRPEEAYFDFIYQPVTNMAGDVQGLMALAVEVTEQRQARATLESRVLERTQELKLAQEALQRLSGRLIRDQDEERRRLSRELHESTGQYMAAIQMNLSALMNDAKHLDEGVRSRLKEAIELVAHCNAETRTLSGLLHPPLLDDVGLASTISWYLGDFTQRSGVVVDLDISYDLPRFSPEVETAVFRIIQQSLGNIHRHSGSSVALIQLAPYEGQLAIKISDKGCGIAPEVLSKFRQSGQLPGFGISGMRERINGLGGTFDIVSSSSGTTISVTLPIIGANLK